MKSIWHLVQVDIQYTLNINPIKKNGKYHYMLLANNPNNKHKIKKSVDGGRIVTVIAL